MIPELINELKQRLNGQQFIEQNYGLGMLYAVNNQKTPVVFDGDEPLQVNFDHYRSLSLWLLNGPVAQNQRDSDVSCGTWVQKKVPLKLIYYSQDNSKKICLPIDEDALSNIISVLVFQDDKKLRELFKLAGIGLQASSQEFRREIVWSTLYGALPFKMQEHEQLFAIDFDLVFEGNPLCWTVPCDPALISQPDNEPLEDEQNENMSL